MFIQGVFYTFKVVKDTTCRIGCGFADCPGNARDKGGRTFVCNYAPAQTVFTNPNGIVIQDDKKKPFKTGTPCSGCGGKCDSSGKLCGEFIFVEVDEVVASRVCSAGNEGLICR